MSRWPTISERGPQVTGAQIAAFETAFGYKLPEDYRAFLLEVNGGQPAATNCEFSKGVVNNLFSLENGDHEGSDLQVRAERARKDLPSPSLLFVGHDDGGARLLIPLEGEHRGQVWFQIKSERPEDANPRVLWHDRRDMTKLADSFEEFMSSLKPLT